CRKSSESRQRLRTIEFVAPQQRDCGRLLPPALAVRVPRCFQWNSARSEAPTTKPQAPKRLQISSSKPSSERCGGHPGGRVEVWTLELLWSLELGSWSFPSE